MYDNYNDSTRQMIANFVLGIRMDKDTVTIPHTSLATPYFHIHGGKILMTNLVGQIVVEADGAQNVHIDHVPTTGTASVIAAAADINSWAIGDILTINGLYSDVFLPTVAAGNTRTGPYAGVVLTPGILNWQTDATTAGDWKWSLWYIPLDDGAYVEVV
jgi:hypothetical protein